ncbi:MAG: DUF3718 domain-containing protein [Kangiellaceae bacterium]|nr:DUF3718 domain-containing protein [Kangiellaceae bacterium]
MLAARKLVIRSSIVEQVSENELTSAHCLAVFEMVNAGLDIALLKLDGSYVNPSAEYVKGNLNSFVCDFIATDDKNRLRKKLRKEKVKLRNFYDGLTCNGLSLLQFAMKNNANSVGTYIVKRLSSNQLKRRFDLEWAGNNGHSSSVIADAIISRTGF